MKIDESRPSTTQATCEGDRQNRREFFNGLGKWSMIVVAAVSMLRGSATGPQASREDPPKPDPEPQRPTWTVSDDRDLQRRMAGTFKPRPGHGNYTRYARWNETTGPGPTHSDIRLQ